MCYNGGMHHDVMKQIRIGVAMHEAYGAWTAAKRSNESSDTIGELYTEYRSLLNLMTKYEPDPRAVF